MKKNQRIHLIFLNRADLWRVALLVFYFSHNPDICNGRCVQEGRLGEIKLRRPSRASLLLENQFHGAAAAPGRFFKGQHREPRERGCAVKFLFQDVAAAEAIHAMPFQGLKEHVALVVAAVHGARLAT